MKNKSIFDTYRRFIQNLSLNNYSKIGVVLTTSSFISFLVFEFARITGILTNAYIGLITYLLFPLIFVIGLILIPVGWYQRKKVTGESTKELLSSQFDSGEIQEGLLGSKLFLKISTFTLLNLFFLMFASTQMLAFMDQPVFCGTACHSVMNPEWVTYQQSPHARVRCVDCHVGEGADALLSSKLNGLWQMVSVTFDLLERPIPTPVRQLRPARETCEKCHWPQKFYGDKFKTIISYKHDKESSPSYSTLLLKIDVKDSKKSAGIHWHISDKYSVRYTSADDKRKEMVRVEVIHKDGSRKQYINTGVIPDNAAALTAARNMDCVDCHNRATHIYENPERALDDRIQAGLISRKLPFIKREGLHAVSKIYPDKKAGFEFIDKHIHGFYRRNFSQETMSLTAEMDQAVKVLQDIYQRNIHPGMKIEWGSYPSFMGHDRESGCFRCHNKKMQAEDGSYIRYDCTTCHSILAFNEKKPLKYLAPVIEKEKDKEMHKYLKEEFLKYYSEE